jgi:hypothetical protein
MSILRPLHCDVLVSSSEGRIRIQIAGIAAAMNNVVGYRPKEEIPCVKNWLSCQM